MANSKLLIIQKLFWDFVIIALLTISILLGWLVLRHNLELQGEQFKYEKMAEEVRKYKSYEKLKKQNPDMVGWLRMKKTKIDYPVMMPPVDDPLLYEHHDFDKNYSFPGTLFIDETTDLELSKNYLIYGHHMVNGTMFGHLSKDIEEGKRIFYYDKLLNNKGTTYERGKYKVIAAFKTSTDVSQPFYDFTNLTTASDFEKYEKMLNQYNEIEGTVDIDMGDELISLATCSYHIWSNGQVSPTGRYLVVGKQIKSTIITDRRAAK